MVGLIAPLSQEGGAWALIYFPFLCGGESEGLNILQVLQVGVGRLLRCPPAE